MTEMRRIYYLYFLCTSIISKPHWSNSVDKLGYGQKELKEALEILDKYPESKVFIIPVRLDDCEESDSRLKEINYVDLFPTWSKGLA